MGSARLAPVASKWLWASCLPLDPARECVRVRECVTGEGHRARDGAAATRVGVTQGQETCCLRMPVLVRVCMFQSGRRDAPLCSVPPRLNGGSSRDPRSLEIGKWKGPKRFLGRGSLVGR